MCVSFHLDYDVPFLAYLYDSTSWAVIVTTMLALGEVLGLIKFLKGYISWTSAWK